MIPHHYEPDVKIYVRLLYLKDDNKTGWFKYATFGNTDFLYLRRERSGQCPWVWETVRTIFYYFLIF